MVDIEPNNPTPHRQWVGRPFNPLCEQNYGCPKQAPCGGSPSPSSGPGLWREGRGILGVCWVLGLECRLELVRLLEGKPKKKDTAPSGNRVNDLRVRWVRLGS